MQGRWQGRGPGRTDHPRRMRCCCTRTPVRSAAPQGRAYAAQIRGPAGHLRGCPPDVAVRAHAGGRLGHVHAPGVRRPGALAAGDHQERIHGPHDPRPAEGALPRAQHEAARVGAVWPSGGVYAAGVQGPGAEWDGMGQGNASRTRETTAWDRDGAAGGMGTLLLTLKAMVTPRAMATTIARRTERETGGSGAPETPNGATCPATGDPQEVAGPGPTRAVCLSDSVCAVSRRSHLRWRCGITRPSTRPLLRHAERLAGPRSREGVCVALGGAHRQTAVVM